MEHHHFLWVNPNINGHFQYYPEKNETYWRAGFCEAEGDLGSRISMLVIDHACHLFVME